MHGLDTSSDNMWVITDSTKSFAYWIASPSTGAGGSDFVMEVSSSGWLTCTNVFSYIGFRPLISIPKSSLK